MVLFHNYGPVKFILMGKSYFGKPLYTTGVYYVDGLMIDSGPVNLNREFSAVYKSLSVKELINTHFHEDHVGNNPEVSESFKLVPKIHKAGIEKISHKPENLDFYRRLTWGTPQASEAEAIGEQVKTDHYEFEVIHTPGHSPDHICLFEPKQRWLFTGDLYLGSRMRLLEKDENIYQILSSLKKLLEYPADVIFCSHRGKMENAGRLLMHKISNMEKLMENVLALNEKGMSVKEISLKLFPDDLFWRIFSNGHLTTRNLVSAFINQRKEGN